MKPYLPANHPDLGETPDPFSPDVLDRVDAAAEIRAKLRARAGEIEEICRLVDRLEELSACGPGYSYTHNRKTYNVSFACPEDIGTHALRAFTRDEETRCRGRDLENFQG